MITACRPAEWHDDRLSLTTFGVTGDLAGLGDVEAARAVLEDAVRQVVSRRASIAPIGLGPSGTGGDAGRQGAYQAAQQHPLVQEMLQRFDADIIAREPSRRDGWLDRIRTATKHATPDAESAPEDWA